VSARRPTAVAPSPLPDRAELAQRSHSDALAVRAAARRAFFRRLAIACPDGHAAVGVSCFVVPNPDQPGAGLGVGWGPGMDQPVVCAKRSSYAAALASA